MVTETPEKDTRFSFVIEKSLMFLTSMPRGKRESLRSLNLIR
jgi:hypothetical protein